MFERAISLRRKLLRAIKVHLWFRKSSSSVRKPDAIIDNSKSDMDVLGMEPADDGVPQFNCKYTSVQSDSEVVVRSPSTAVRTDPDIDAVPIRELTSKTPLTIVVPPRTPVSVQAQSPLRTPISSDHSGPSRTIPSPADCQEFVSQVESFQRVQQQLQRRAITRAQSMPLSFSDPMRKLRDSYVRIMQKIAEDEAMANPLSPSSAPVFSDQSRVFDYLHQRRSPAAEEEEEFCRLAVMRTKLNRSQSLS